MTQKFSSETVGIHTRLDDIDEALDEVMGKAKQNEELLKQLLRRVNEVMDDTQQASAINRLNVS